MNKINRLMIVAGGTGGHIFPGLAVAHHLMNQGWQVRWLGTANHMEADLVLKYGIEIDFIHVSGLRGKKMKELIFTPVHIFNALRKARIIIKRFKPNVVLGMGGYVSGPGSIAAWSLGIPVILHEQNSVAGLTNKYLAKLATKVMQAFPGTLPNAKVVGNPLRIDVLSLPSPQYRLSDRKGPIRILVIGGSQGAFILNQIMPQVASKMTSAFIIWHQSGKGSQQVVDQAYARILVRSQYKVTEFIENIAAAYAWADVVICRSGALTVSEICAVGLPAIFVPFQHKDRQQYWNATLLEKAGAARIFEHMQFTADSVATTLAGWNRQILLDMAIRARANAILDSTERVANEVNLVVKA